MIVSFKHKGLERFFLKGDSSKLNQAHLPRIRKILAQLNTAKNIQDVNVPGWDLHPLKGNLKDHWSVKVSGNYRITFIFIGERVEVLDINYLDYH
jgi:toxin HigB-1